MSEETSENVILTDICSKSNKKISYLVSNVNDDLVRIETSRTTQWKFFQYLIFLLKEIFLPKGYPDSVSSDYLEYQIWDTCQAFCSSISGTLAMRAVMQGIGVGSEAATPVSAAITWIIKDGTGMIGSIFFAWLKGSKLDSDCKKWRLFADVLNDIAMLLELYIPFLKDHSMSILCIATVFKALVGTAGGSTRAALITHQAVKENIADVSAKDGSQEIVTNLIAFIFGIFILKNVTETNEVWAVMFTAAVFHIFFNYKAMRCLKINVFNGERFRLSLISYLPTSSLPTIAQVNRRESVFLFSGTSNFQLCGFSISFGKNLKKAIQSQNMLVEQLESLITLFQDKNYFILVHNKRKEVYVTFRVTFDDLDVLKAYFHAFLIGISVSFLEGEYVHVISRSRKKSPLFRLKNILLGTSHLQSDKNADHPESAMIMKAFRACHNIIDREFSSFRKACIDQAWNIKKHLINIDDWRAIWKYSAKKQEIERSQSKKPSTPKVEEMNFSKNPKSKMSSWNNLIIS